MGRWYKHYELGISWANHHKYVTLIFAGVVSHESLTVIRQNPPSGRLICGWINKQMILVEERLFLDMYLRAAVGSPRSLCPAEHLPLQIDYPGGGQTVPTPRRHRTPPTAAALIKSWMKSAVSPTQRSNSEPGPALSTYSGFMMDPTKLDQDRLEQSYIPRLSARLN